MNECYDEKLFPLEHQQIFTFAVAVAVSAVVVSSNIVAAAAAAIIYAHSFMCI